MYRTLLSEAGFRKGMDLYFKRHDGQAVSCDDFRAAMADANEVNFDQFERWYLQVRGVQWLNRSEMHDKMVHTYVRVLLFDVPEPSHDYVGTA